MQRAESARGVIKLTGVPASRVLEQNGMGGPLIPINFTAGRAPSPDDPFQRRIYEVEARLQRSAGVRAGDALAAAGHPGADAPTAKPRALVTAPTRSTAARRSMKAPILQPSPARRSSRRRRGRLSTRGSRGPTAGRSKSIMGPASRHVYGHMNSITVKARPGSRHRLENRHDGLDWKKHGTAPAL